MYDTWPPIRVARFDDEPADHYARRRDEIVTIINSFRHRRLSGEIAEKLDARLDGLLSGLAEIRRPESVR